VRRQRGSRFNFLGRYRNANLILKCEQPNLTAGEKISGFSLVRGWASPRSRVKRIEILVDQAHVGAAFYGFARPDVIRSSPELGGEIHLGFAFRLDATKLSIGSHVLKIVAIDEKGQTTSLEGNIEVVQQRQSKEVPSSVDRSAFRSNPDMERPSSISRAGETVEVSVVIFARNQAEFLSRSLPVIVNQKTSFRFEVIGFDTESDDGTPHVFRRHGVRVVPVRRDEFHHMRTRLQSLQEARGSLVVFLVGDALPADAYWLEALVWPLIDDPLVAATYSRQLPAGDCVPWEARDIYLGCSVVREVKQVNWSRPAEVENYRKNQGKFISFSDVSACYRRELLESLPIPEALPEVEDQYWCKCLLEAGYRVVLEPTSLVIHSHNHSAREVYQRQVRFGRCFATFTDVSVEPMSKLVFGTLKDTVNDLFFIVGCKTSSLRKWKWILQAPLMRFLKRYGLRKGFRIGAFGDGRVSGYEFTSTSTSTSTNDIRVPTERAK
jgi:rhamnosyltransferase